MFQESLMGVSRKFQGSFKRVSMVFQLLSVISVSREIYEPFKEVSKVFQWYFKAVKDVSVVFRDCFKEVKSISKVFQRRFVLFLLSSLEQKEGLLWT